MQESLSLQESSVKVQLMFSCGKAEGFEEGERLNVNLAPVVLARPEINFRANS